MISVKKNVKKKKEKKNVIDHLTKNQTFVTLNDLFCFLMLMNSTLLNPAVLGLVQDNG